MALFSERKGLVPAKTPQTASMDGPLRNALWTVFHELLFKEIQKSYYRGSSQEDKQQEVFSFLRLVWVFFFKEPSDTYPGSKVAVQKIRSSFMSADWHKVYSLVEYIFEEGPDWAPDRLRAPANNALERENAAYRIIGSIVTDIISPEEMAEVGNALATKITVVRNHLTSALEHLSSRENPDPRNSIKESISAVESVCRLVAGGQTLDDALKALGDKVQIHPALVKAFRSLYGFSSDQVRHGLLKEGTVGKTEARFMLVACSAFINYVIAHAAEAGIKLGT